MLLSPIFLPHAFSKEGPNNTVARPVDRLWRLMCVWHVFIKLLTYLGPILQVNSAMVNTTSYLCRRLRLLLLVVQSQQPWVVFSWWCSRQRRFVVRLNFYSISHPACVGCRDDVMQFSGGAYSAPQTLWWGGGSLLQGWPHIIWPRPHHILASLTSLRCSLPRIPPRSRPFLPRFYGSQNFSG